MARGGDRGDATGRAVCARGAVAARGADGRRAGPPPWPRPLGETGDCAGDPPAAGGGRSRRRRRVDHRCGCRGRRADPDQSTVASHQAAGRGPRGLPAGGGGHRRGARRAASEGRHGEARRYSNGPRRSSIGWARPACPAAARAERRGAPGAGLAAGGSRVPTGGGCTGGGVPAEVYRRRCTGGGVPAEGTRVAPPRSTDRGDSAGTPARTPEPSDRLPGTNHLQAGYGQPSAAGADGHGRNTVPRPHPGP
jgi:hypothetical protein